jgi:branched-chain amino acid transport system ATP-binding protein
MANVGQDLVVRDLTVRFGGVVANNSVSLEAKAGRITGLIGPNGAGKTTFINAVTGFVPSRGEIAVGGQSISQAPAYKRRRHGLSRTWQAGELFDSLTVLDNIRVADENAGLLWLFKDLVYRARSGQEHAFGILERVGLAEQAGCFPGELSLGHRRLVGVARALAGEPSVLLLDEPAAGLDSSESMRLGRRLQSIATDGPAILLVDHDVRLVFDVADYVYVLDFGTLIAEGVPRKVQRDQAVVDAYLGSSLAMEAN